jgi:Serine endopeptidase inhibitors
VLNNTVFAEMVFALSIKSWRYEMKDKVNETPFFARYLEGQEFPNVKTNVKAGAGAVTHKYPSDQDERYDETQKYPSDNDEFPTS